MMKHIISAFAVFLFTMSAACSDGLFRIENFKSKSPEKANQEVTYPDLWAEFVAAYDNDEGGHRIIVRFKNIGKKVKVPYQRILGEAQVRLSIDSLGVIDPGFEGIPIPEKSLNPEAFMILETGEVSHVILSFSGTRYANFLKPGSRVSFTLKEVTSAVATFEIKA